MSAEDARRKLHAVPDRRNKIAHEADLDPTDPEARWPITPEIANEAISFLISLAHAIYSVVKVSIALGHG